MLTFDTPSQMHPALDLPDIQRQIVEHLTDDQTSLCRLAQVNGPFNFEASHRIWRAPRIDALQFVAPKRRQLYAMHVRQLSLSAAVSAEQLSVLSRLDFPLLQRLELAEGWSQIAGAAVVSRFLHHDLQTLHLSAEQDMLAPGAYRALLEHVHDACPQLEAMEFAEQCLAPDRGLLLELVRWWPKLKTLALAWPAGDVLDADLLCAVAARTGLKTICIGQCISRDLMRTIACNIPDPFRGVREVHMQLPSDAMPAFVSLMRRAVHLTHLCLHLADTRFPIVQPIAESPLARRLRDLKLHFAENAVVAGRDAVLLGKLGQLRSLAIGPRGSHNVRVKDFDDNEFVELVSGLPNLRRLCFRLRCWMSNDHLRRLGESCPQLESLDMSGLFGLGYLSKRGAPLWPRLRLLRLGSAQTRSFEFIDDYE
jgi:hypothetical protein